MTPRPDCPASIRRLAVLGTMLASAALIGMHIGFGE